MNINAQRPWITPLVTGIFLLMAVTGSLMFFHLDSGLNKSAHEWLGWAMVAAVLLHLLLNVNAFKRHLLNRTGRWVMGACALALGLSSVPLGGQGGGNPPFAAPLQALAQAPLGTVAQVAGVKGSELRARLSAVGVASQSDGQSIQDLVGTDMGQQIRTLGKVFAKAQSVAAR
jgi:hypothetical protein